jgi:hypothetical protein
MTNPNEKAASPGKAAALIPSTNYQREGYFYDTTT